MCEDCLKSITLCGQQVVQYLVEFYQPFCFNGWAQSSTKYSVNPDRVTTNCYYENFTSFSSQQHNTRWANRLPGGTPTWRPAVRHFENRKILSGPESFCLLKYALYIKFFVCVPAQFMYCNFYLDNALMILSLSEESNISGWVKLSTVWTIVRHSW